MKSSDLLFQRTHIQLIPSIHMEGHTLCSSRASDALLWPIRAVLEGKTSICIKYNRRKERKERRKKKRKKWSPMVSPKMNLTEFVLKAIMCS